MKHFTGCIALTLLVVGCAGQYSRARSSEALPEPDQTELKSAYFAEPRHR
jgi:hypothetical protein